MKVVTFINTCLHDPQDARDPALVAPFLHNLVSQGFLLANEMTEYRTVFSPWEDLILYPDSEGARAVSEQRRQELFTPGITPVLQTSLSHYLADQLPELILYVISTATTGGLRGLDFLFKLTRYGDEESPELIFYTTASTTWEYLATKEKRDFWMALPVFLYESWHGLFTYLGFENDPATTQAEARAMHFHHLYNVNIFGPEAVAHFGRERMLATPGARVQEMADGGILLIPTNIEQAAAHLGLAPTYLLEA